MGLALSWFDFLGQKDFEILSDTSEIRSMNGALISDIQPDLNAFDASSYSHPDDDSDLNAVDARGEMHMGIFKAPKISSSQLAHIERQLDFYEKVSIVFLLYDNVDLALQELEFCWQGSERDFLTNWAKTTTDWELKLIEAVTIVQNYEIIRLLGCKKNDVQQEFLPTFEKFYKRIPKERKILYLLCEKLTGDQTQKFIKMIKTDLTQKRLDIKPYGEDTNLEMYFLHWASIGYISLSQNLNIDKIYSAFKQLEYDNICDMLKVLIDSCGSKPDVSRHNSNTNYNRKLNQIDTYEEGNVDHSLYSNPESSIRSQAAPDIKQNSYHIDPNNPGLCLIINQLNFYRDPRPEYQHLLPDIDIRLDQREGTNKDRDCLKNTFLRYGYKVKLINNIDHTDMIPYIKRVLESIRDESSIFVCILSHGEEGYIYGVNSCKVSIEEIKRTITHTNMQVLLYKPKVLILQSCQGRQCQKIPEQDFTVDEDELITTDGPSKAVPPFSNLLTFYATVSGYAAIRHKRSGAWLIEALCKKMIEEGNRCHFEDICTSVTNLVSQKSCKMKEEVVGMLPEKRSTFTKQLYLPKLKSEEEVKDLKGLVEWLKE